jgi:uncharacterized peroxidase-related enzyme
MVRLTAQNPETATGKTKELFNAIHAKLGVVPNMMRTMGNSPAFLGGYLALSGALDGGKLGPKTATLIALAVAESNGCNYCLSAHTYLGGNLVKIDAATMDAARSGNGPDAKTDAILKFAKLVVNQRGNAGENDINELKALGVLESEIAEIFGHVALNILTNYFNQSAGTEIDFPVVEAQIPAPVY